MQAKEQGRLTGDYLKQPSLNQRESGEQFHSNGSNVELSSNRASHTGPQAQAQGGSAGQPRRESQQQSEAQAEMQAEQEPLYQRQGSSSAGTDSQPAYLYISDATTPSQDGALQWSIGGVPLQQQLRSVPPSSLVLWTCFGVFACVRSFPQRAWNFCQSTDQCVMLSRLKDRRFACLLPIIACVLLSGNGGPAGSSL